MYASIVSMAPGTTAIASPQRCISHTRCAVAESFGGETKARECPPVRRSFKRIRVYDAFPTGKRFNRGVLSIQSQTAFKVPSSLRAASRDRTIDTEGLH